MTRSGSVTSGRDLLHERQRRRQPTVVERAHDLEPIGAAARGLARVGEGLDDDFEEETFHVRRGQAVNREFGSGRESIHGLTPSRIRRLRGAVGSVEMGVSATSITVAEVGVTVSWLTDGT